MSKPSKIEQAVSFLEAKKAADQIPARLQERIAALGGVRSDVKESLSAKDVPAEPAPEVTGIARFKEQYEMWKPEHKANCQWQEVESRLLANDGHFLKLAEAMHQGGILFGVDKAGNPLIADGGVEPIMAGMNYADTRRAVMFKEIEGGQAPTGYELFPYSDNYQKSAEISAFEDFTKEPFIRSENKKEYRSSWLESGEDPDWPRGAFFSPGSGLVYEDDDVSTALSDPRLGVRRLLRVKKS